MPASTPPSLKIYVTAPGIPGLPSYLDVRVDASSAPLAFPVNSLFDSWCAQRNAPINVPGTYTANAYSSYELGLLATMVPGIGGFAKLDEINWLLNNAAPSATTYSETINGTLYSGLRYYNLPGLLTNFTYGDIQQAISTLLGQGTPSNPLLGSYDATRIAAIVTEANAHNGFVPDVTDVDPNNDKIVVVLDTFTDGNNNGRRDAGEAVFQPLLITVQSAALGDFVWLDNNLNGTQDGVEPGVAGVVVKLVRDMDGDGAFSGANELLATTVTNAAGYYQFKGLTPGLDYQVQFVLPTNHSFTLANQGADDALDSDAGAGGNTQVVVLSPGEFNRTLDAGLVPVPRAALGNYVWEDLNADGIQNDGASGIGGVTVTLTGGGPNGVIGTGGDDTTATTTTDGTGFYSFSGLNPGEQYQVSFTRPAAYVSFTKPDATGDSSDSDANTLGVTPILTLTPGEFNQTIDAGLLEPATVGDFVWRDTNGDGIQNDGATGVGGVTVTLTGTDALGNPVSRNNTTDGSGGYLFNGNTLLPGTYSVRFSGLPLGLAFTAPDQGGHDSNDSDANTTTGATPSVTVGSGGINRTLDAGLVGTGIDIIKYVNGQDANNPTGPVLVVGSTATFTYEVRNTGNVPLASVVVGDDNGTPGNTGDDFNPSYSGGDDGDNLLEAGETWLYSATRTVVAGQYTNIASTTGTPVYPPGTTGVPPSTPVAGLTPPTDTDPANYFGEQRDYGDLPSPLYGSVLGAYHVFADQALRMGAAFTDAEPAAQPNPTATGDDGTGADDESGVVFPASIVAGQGVSVTVSAVNFSGSPATLYGFIDWNRDGDFLDAGEAATTVLADGFFGSAALSFAVPATATTGLDLGARFRISTQAGLDAIAPAPNGEVEDYLVQALPQRANLGNYVWEDLNANGVQDEPASAGVSNVTVTLLGGGADGLINGLGDTTATTTTDASGFYLFSNLNPGEQYQVTFAKPGAYVSFTRPDNTGDAADSDADVSTGKAPIVTLAAGQFNDSIDAGLLRPVAIGDYVWRDTNGNGIQDESGTGVPGVTVTLSGTDALGNPVSRTTTTDANGGYLFNGGTLLPGSYKVSFSNLPSGLAFTARDQGANDAADSDADASTSGMTPTVTLGSGAINRTLDAGLVGTGIDIIKLVNGVDANNPTGPVLVVGSTATFTYEVRNTGNVSLKTLTVSDDNGTPGVPGDDFAPAFTGGDANGNTLLDLGEVWTYSATRTVVAGQYTNIASTTGTPVYPPGTSFPPGTPVPGLTPPTDTDPANYFGEQRDYGDLPSPLYSGVLGAYHVFASQALRIGSSNTDAEPAAQPNASATGDDLAGATPDDESGVAIPASIIAGQSTTFNVSVSNTIGSAATLYGFVDWNRDGDFLDAGETATAAVANGFSGNAALLFNVPTTAATGQDLGARFRISTQAGLDAVAPAVSGEVEDYLLQALPQRASLGNYVWEDLNANGAQDEPASAGISNVTVTLFGGGPNGVIGTGGDDTTVTTTTNASGFYSFTGLNPGEQYQVTFTKPGAYVSFTKPDATGDALDSDANTLGATPVVVLSPGQNNDTIDAGLLRPVAIGDYVWRDTNGNGIQDEPGSGVPGVTVTLSGTDALGNPVSRSTTTDASGGYLFNGGTLLPGSYKVTFSGLPAGLAFTAPDQGLNDATDSDANPSNGMTPTVTLGSGQSNLTLDAGLVGTGIRIIKYVNGQDANAAPGPSLLVGSTATFTYTVTNTGNVSLASVVVSDDNGTPAITGDDFAPSFTGGDSNSNGLLDLGEAWTYSAARTVVAGQYTNIASTSGTPVYPPGTNVPGTPVPGLTPPSSNDPANYNGVPLASLGNYVWEDLDANGVQDDGASGIFGVSVTLKGAGPDNVLGTGDDTTATTSTDGSGFYQFTNLIPGTPYQVSFTRPAGFVSFTKADATGDTSDSDANTLGVTPVVVLSPGQFNDTIDAGLLRPITIGDYVWRDTNGNGIQDESGTGVPGVTVTLSGTDALGNPVSRTTTTDANGGYLFNGGTLLPGSYKVTFSGLPAGLAFTARDQGLDDAKDSDADASTSGMTPTVTLGSGAINRTLDAGLVGTGIDIIKLVNGVDANNPAGPVLVVGSTATFTYEVRNTGNVSLRTVTVSDDNGTPGNTGDDFAPAFTGGDANNNGLLDLNEIWTYSATRTVVAGQYINIASTTGTPVYPPGTSFPPGTPVPGLTPPADTDPANYFGEQRDYGDLPSLLYGSVLGAYHVFASQALRIGSSNTDAEPAAQPNASATGDDLAGATPDDETGVTIPASIIAGQSTTFNVSVSNTIGSTATLYGFVDWNRDGDFLDAGETATAAVANGFSGSAALLFNVPASAVVGMDLGTRFRIATDASLTAGNNATNGEVEDYLVQVSPPPSGGIRLVKATNAANPLQPTAAEDANVAPGLGLPVGTDVVWTYQVFNESSVPLQITSLIDDAGTPQTAADNFNPVAVTQTSGPNTGKNVGDSNGDSLLNPGEVWLYTSAGVPAASYKAQLGIGQLAPSLTFGWTQANGYALLGLNNGNVTVNSATAVTGDFGYSRGVTSTSNLKIGEDFLGQWNGTAYVHTQVGNFQYSSKDYIPAGGIVSNAAQDARLDTANAEALAASAQLAALATTVNLGVINDTSAAVGAVNGAANLNVVQISSLNMNSDVLTLTGDEQDYFVINVLGNFNFSQSEVRLVGGVTANHVIFNFPTSGTQTADVLINKSSTIFNGTILAPDLDGYEVEYHNPAVFNGAIIAKNITVHSDFNLNYAPFFTGYTNVASVTGNQPGTNNTFSDTDVSNHYGYAVPNVDLVKTARIDIDECPTGPIGTGNDGSPGTAGVQPVAGIDLGGLTDFLFFFGNGATDANWQGATKGFAGDVAIDGKQAAERTSGGVPFAGTIYTNDTTLGAWQGIVDQNPGQAFKQTGHTALIAGLENDLIGAFQQINALTVTPGYANRSATSLNGLNTQNGIDETIVINVTSGFQVSSKINVTGDAGDVFVLRWDTDQNFSDGYEGQVKFQSGGAIVPLGGLGASNFIHVAGDINSSGGGSNPASPYPQGPRLDDGTGALVDGAQNFNGGGFFTGYWLTTGAPTTLDAASGLYIGGTAPLSNGIFVGGWYTLTTKFSMTSGTSGVHVCPDLDIIQTDNDFNPGNVGVDGGTASGHVGDLLTYSFKVSNTGTIALSNVRVLDDNATPGNALDDFFATAVLKANGKNHGDVNNNGMLDVGENWYFQSKDYADAAGSYTNTATVYADYAGGQVTDMDVALVGIAP